MDIQIRYWKRLVQAKFSCFYIDQYYNASIRAKRIISIILALISSGSIASWAIWSHLAFLWAFIVAASQVLTIVNSYLPYESRSKELFSYKWELYEIYRQMEYKWFAVSEGELTASEINELISDFSQKANTASQKILSKDYLRANSQYKLIADTETNNYFDNNF